MNIELKKCTIEDAKELSAVCCAIDRTYIADRLPSPYTKEDALWWIGMAKERDGIDGIFRLITVDGKVIGNISIEQKADVFRKDAEIGYMILREYWKKGIATEAVKQVCEIGFLELDIIRITGLVYEPNTASQRVLEKNGFELEGCMKDAVIKNGNVYNLCVYGKRVEKKFNIV